MDFFWYRFNITIIIMIPEKVHKTYYKIMLKKYTTKIQKKDLKNKPASTGFPITAFQGTKI